MQDPYFFGYGSLVNRATHAHEDAHPATLRGWRRMWRHTALRPVAFLTVVPAPGSRIDGLIAAVPGADWLALDEREHAYDRVSAAEVAHPLPHSPDVHLYTIPDGKHGAPDRTHPVLLSYVDTVVQGFLNEFGEDGVARFFATTDGWDAPIADDRKTPRYTRHQTLTRAERALVDQHLEGLSAVVQQLE
ncbi:MAG: gamma-glutamylcyclotransferase family protein [Pseudomonadota bacterium]